MKQTYLIVVERKLELLVSPIDLLFFHHKLKPSDAEVSACLWLQHRKIYVYQIQWNPPITIIFDYLKFIFPKAFLLYDE